MVKVTMPPPQYGADNDNVQTTMGGDKEVSDNEPDDSDEATSTMM